MSCQALSKATLLILLFTVSLGRSIKRSLFIYKSCNEKQSFQRYSSPSISFKSICLLSNFEVASCVDYCFQCGPNSSQPGLKNKGFCGYNSQQQRIHTKLQFLSAQFIQTYLKLAEHSHTPLLWTPTSTYWRTIHINFFPITQGISMWSSLRDRLMSCAPLIQMWPHLACASWNLHSEPCCSAIKAQ